MFDHLFEPDVSQVEIEQDVIDVYDEDAEGVRASEAEAKEAVEASARLTRSSATLETRSCALAVHLRHAPTQQDTR